MISDGLLSDEFSKGKLNVVMFFISGEKQFLGEFTYKAVTVISIHTAI